MKTSFVLVPEGLQELYKGAFVSTDRFNYPSVRAKTNAPSRKRLVALTLKSIMPQAKIVWDNLTTAQKDAWTSASAFGHQSGWQLFLRDYAIRIKNSLSVPSTPNNIVQYKCGHIVIGGSATAIKLEQIHPLTYFVQRKVTNTRSQYKAVKVQENFDLPLSIAISWRTALTSAGASPSAKFYALVLSHYQGRDIETPIEINFGLTDAWKRDSASLSQVLGYVKGYSIYISANDVHGIIEFDNVEILHSGQNWARDPKCDNIQSEFTKAFYQIPRHWAPELLPTGAYFLSQYYDL
jgi:hypothetical protein